MSKIIPASVSPNSSYEIKEKLARLEEMLVNQNEGIATVLRDIHTQVKKDPELVTILSEEEVSILVRGLKKQTATEIAVATVKKSPKKAMSKMTVDDL